MTQGVVRVLVVDDDAVSRRVAQEALRQLGHDADVVDSGTEAVEHAARTEYDLILMDCEMPEVDGYEATRRIRAAESEGGHRATIVAVTGSVAFDDEARCFEAGMDAYVTKPLKARRLQAVIAGLPPHAAL